MPQFVRRYGGADLDTNEYYNEEKYVGGGKYKGNKNYQCVNYVIGRSCELAETIITKYKSVGLEPEHPIFKRNGYGNAVNWWNDTLWEKTTNPDEIKLGDIVVYGSNWGKGYGHVRVVEAIEDNYLILSGGNEDSKGSCKFDIKVLASYGAGSNGKNLMGYIHNPYLTHYIPPVIDYKTKYEEAQRKLDEIKEIVNE